MSVSEQITRLENAKTALKTSIEAKGVTVPDNATLTDYSSYVDAIQSGGSAGGGSDDVLESLIDRSITEISNSNITSIGACAFYTCTSLTTVSFPNCSTIGISAFANTKLTTVDFPACKDIGNNAFYWCSSLTTLSFPACTNIGDNAFYSCTSLTTLSFPVCTNIGNYAFSSCTKLTTVDFPACTNIGNSAFSKCTSLTTASFPACTLINRYAFASCVKLMSLYLTGSSVPTLSNINAFYSTPMSVSTLTGAFGSIFVQASLLNAFKTATNWATYADRITAYGEQGGGEQGGGEQGGETTTITFTIGQKSYQAEQGMTFRDWVNSTYNTDNFYIQSNYIYSSDGFSYINSTPSSIINAGDTYYLTYGGGGGAN